MHVAYGPPGKKGVDELWAVNGDPEIDALADTPEQGSVLMLVAGTYLVGHVVKSRFAKDAAIGAAVTLLAVHLLGR